MIVTGAKVGQAVKVTAVDENGVPTAWEPFLAVTKVSVTADGVIHVTESDDNEYDEYGLANTVIVTYDTALAEASHSSGQIAAGAGEGKAVYFAQGGTVIPYVRRDLIEETEGPAIFERVYEKDGKLYKDWAQVDDERGCAFGTDELDAQTAASLRVTGTVSIGTAKASGRNSFAAGAYKPYILNENDGSADERNSFTIRQLTDEEREAVYAETGKYYQYLEYDDAIDDESTPAIALVNLKKTVHVTESEYVDCGDPAVCGDVFNIADGEEIEADYDGACVILYDGAEIDFTQETVTAEASGDYSFAYGNGATASGEHSSAVGKDVKSSGVCAHAEGKGTTASGGYAHAEGQNTTASGNSAHAEGASSVAVGNQAHAEGSITTARGTASHAEGAGTNANGDYSHAEGYNTVASAAYSHVQGKYNIIDNENKYAHIVGNGTNTARSNAHTVDWDGNAWYAGDIEAAKTLYLHSPDGTKFAITVSNDGTLTATAQ